MGTNLLILFKRGVFLEGSFREGVVEGAFLVGLFRGGVLKGAFLEGGAFIVDPKYVLTAVHCVVACDCAP